MFNTATAVGPAVAGVTYALFGPAWCFVINGISFIAVIAALAAMRLKPFVAQGPRASVAEGPPEGIRFVLRHETIRALIATIGIVSVFGLAFATLVPAWAVKMLGGDATTNGLLQSARGAGALIGALLIASLGRFEFKGTPPDPGDLRLSRPAHRLLAHPLASPVAPRPLFGVGVAQIFIFNLCNSLVQTQVPEGAPRPRHGHLQHGLLRNHAPRRPLDRRGRRASSASRRRSSSAPPSPSATPFSSGSSCPRCDGSNKEGPPRFSGFSENRYNRAIRFHGRVK